MVTRWRGAIEGIVQGVGFRPFVFQLALKHGLAGFVVNTAEGVDIEVEGPEREVRLFIDHVKKDQPPLAFIASASWTEIPPAGEEEFAIGESLAGGERSTIISPDVGVCPECLAEMRDTEDRRFRYPFINCTNCGPRYTIIMDIPYDRVSTTMKKFPMCQACAREYEDPRDRRFHAQPNACWDCGPHTSLHDGNGNRVECPDPVKEAVSLLERGLILAVKGLGGFHLAVDASNHRGVTKLRRRKHREEKPLAIMVKDLDTARGIAQVSPTEAQLLESRQRPIVLLKKLRSHGLSPQVAPKNRNIGIMLPYTPLHHLLMEGGYKALVMTSGNMTEEPINTDNGEAFTRLGRIADYFLVHNRDIYLRSDDSVLRVVSGIPRQIRRSRGYVPVPVFLPPSMKKLPSTLGLGGELKNTVCLTKGNRAFLSQHVGDMENLETFDFFQLTIGHLRRILEIEPKILAHDLHPDYLSSKFAREEHEIPRLGVQHHHAHIVSCLAEHGITGPVIGVAMDGTGLGLDGNIWGGEVFLSDLVSFERKAHLEYIPLPGGDAAARFPWRMALVYMHRAFGEGLFELDIPFVRNLDSARSGVILQMAHNGVNSPLTSSCGRLFDAVSALIGLREKIAYEGQAAVELEMCQSSGDGKSYPWEVGERGRERIMITSGIIRGIVEDIEKGVTRGVISRRFHNTLAEMLGETCVGIGEETGILKVVLTGGAFQNATLLTALTESLEGRGFTVYSHAWVPTNDGSLSLGQAVCAGLVYSGLEGAFEESYEIY